MNDYQTLYDKVGDLLIETDRLIMNSTNSEEIAQLNTAKQRLEEAQAAYVKGGGIVGQPIKQ